MAGIVCFTSFTCAYLPRALILARTLRAAHPDWTLHALLVDALPEHPDALAALDAFDSVVTAEQLDIADFPPWIFKHDIVEAATAVKGRMLLRLLERGADHVMYLDPDIAVFHTLTGITERLDAASILLTPHQIAPNTSTMAINDNEITSLQFGIYNLGFLVVRNDANGRAFAAWWADMLHRACYDTPETGVFTDQKYCDLVPGLFEGVVIVRDPGCNVASWNLSQRTISFTGGGRIEVDGSLLQFYHFSKIGSVGDVMTARYGAENAAVFEIWNWYKRQLAGMAFPRQPWRYDVFDNGEPIPKSARTLFRTRADLMATFHAPFAVGPGTFHDWLRNEAPHILAASE